MHSRKQCGGGEKTMEFFEATLNAVNQSLQNSKRKLPTTKLLIKSESKIRAF